MFRHRMVPLCLSLSHTPFNFCLFFLLLRHTPFSVPTDWHLQRTNETYKSIQLWFTSCVIGEKKQKEKKGKKIKEGTWQNSDDLSVDAFVFLTFENLVVHVQVLAGSPLPLPPLGTCQTHVKMAGPLDRLVRWPGCQIQQAARVVCSMYDLSLSLFTFCCWWWGWELTFIQYVVPVTCMDVWRCPPGGRCGSCSSLFYWLCGFMILLFWG